MIVPHREGVANHNDPCHASGIVTCRAKRRRGFTDGPVAWRGRHPRRSGDRSPLCQLEKRRVLLIVRLNAEKIDQSRNGLAASKRMQLLLLQLMIDI